MKALLVVLLQSFVLTVFITLVAQAYAQSDLSIGCNGRMFNMKKCGNSAEAMRGPLH
jgi:hypothetical protein